MRKQLKYLLILPCMLAFSSFLIASCSNQNPTSDSVVPAPPIDPDVSVDVDSVKHEINIDYLRTMIKTNDYGYSPDAMNKWIQKLQKDKNEAFLTNIFADHKKISNWNSITHLNVIANDANGTISMQFDYGGTHTYKIELNKTHGLLADADFYKKMDDLTFALRISSTSVVSERNFPVIDGNNIVKNHDANISASFVDKFNPDGTLSSSSKGTKLNGQFTKDKLFTGTGFLVDYLPNENVQDFYEFIVATNVHISDMSNAFYYYNDSSQTSPHTGLALDPIYIKTSWAKHNGQLDYTNPNSFTNKNMVDNHNVFKNLSFQYEKDNGNREDNFVKNVIKDVSRLNKEDKDAFSTWDHPLSANAQKQKHSILNDISFYEPEYSATFDYKDRLPSNFWKQQLPSASFTYNNLQPDLTFIKTQFTKTDLMSQWPSLYAALNTNQMDSYLLPLKNDVMNPIDDVAYYYAGNPYYEGIDPKSVDGKREEINGFNWKTHNPGSYYRSGKAIPKLVNKDGQEINFNQWPNNVDIDYVDLNHWHLVGGPGIDVKPDPDQADTANLNIYWTSNKTVKKWAPYNPQTINETTLKTVFVSSESNWLNSQIAKNPLTNPEFNTEYYTNSVDRGMVKSTNNAMKKYMWGTSELIMGGNSGSIVISPKMQISGIISSRKTGPDVNFVKHGLIEAVVNPAKNIVKGDKIISQGVANRLKSLNMYSTLYNKKPI